MEDKRSLLQHVHGCYCQEVKYLTQWASGQPIRPLLKIFMVVLVFEYCEIKIELDSAAHLLSGI